MSITKETKWRPQCCCRDNSFPTGAVLIKTEIPSFGLNQEPSIDRSYDNIGTMYTSVFQVGEECNVLDDSQATEP